MLPRHYTNLRKNIPYELRFEKEQDYSNYFLENSRTEFVEKCSPNYCFEPRTVYPSHCTEQHVTHLDKNTFTRSNFTHHTPEQHVYSVQDQLRQVDDSTYKRTTTRSYNSRYTPPQKIVPPAKVYSLTPKHIAKGVREGALSFSSSKANRQPRVVSLGNREEFVPSAYSNQGRQASFRTNQGNKIPSQNYIAQKQSKKTKVSRITEEYCHSSVTPHSISGSGSSSYDRYPKQFNVEADYQEPPYVTSRTKTRNVQPPLISSCYKMKGDQTNERSPTRHQPYVTSHKIVTPNRKIPCHSNDSDEDFDSTEISKRPRCKTERSLSHKPVDKLPYPVQPNSEKIPPKPINVKKTPKPKNKLETPADEKDDKCGTSLIKLKTNTTASKTVKSTSKPEQQKKSFLVPLPNSMESGITWAYIPLPNNMLSSNESEFLERRTLICFIHKFLSLMFQSVLNNEKRIVGEHVLRVTLDGKEQLQQVPAIIQEMLATGVKITELNLPRSMCTMRKKRQGFLIFIKVEEAEHERIILEIFTKKGFKISNTLNKIESSKQEQ